MKEIIRTAIMSCGSLMYESGNSMILYYHDFHNKMQFTSQSTPLSVFKRHVGIIRKKGYSIVPRITNEKGQVVIMMDDGHAGIWDCRDYLINESIYPTIFITKNLVGSTDKLTEEQIRRMDKEGFNFQSHTVNHGSLWEQSDNVVRNELRESKLYLEELLSKEIDGFCAPFGKFTRTSCIIAREEGYKYFYACTPGFYSDIITEFNFVKTRNAAQSLTDSQLKLVLNGGNKIFQNIYLTRRYKTI